MSRINLFSAPHSLRARLLTIAVTATIVLGVTSVPAHALPSGTSAEFELDGNAVTDATTPPPDDWQNVLAGTGHDFSHNFVTDTPAGDGTYFTGGGSKDIHDISDWAYNNLGAQDKDEITHAYSAAYINGGNGHLDLYFGMDRYANSGDSTAGFWFFQNKIGLDGSGGFTGSHAVGDLLIVSDFTNGGAISGIKAYKWNGTGLTAFTATGGDCSISINDPLCAIVNQTDTTSPWSYTPKSGTPGTFPAIGSFLEGGIDLNDSHIFGTNVPCFSGFLAETRASQSTDSTLSDFALGSVNTCGKVTGTKYNDINANHTKDSGEPGLEGWTITLTKTGGSSVTTTTDADGNFEFDDVEPGSYTVCETFKATWFQTQPTSGQTCPDGHGYAFTVALGDVKGPYLFGNTQHPDLSITKVADAATVSAGDQIGYTITVSNSSAAGTGTATGVKLSDTLPTNSGLSWTIDTTTSPPSAGWGGTCGISTGVLSCGGASGVTLAPGASLSVHIVSPTTKATCGVVHNSASATSGNDGSPSVGPIDITVNCPVLAIAKVADADTVDAGSQIGYTITVTNTASAGTATGVKLSDTLPTNAGLSWTIDTTTNPPSAGWGGTCGIDTGVLTCGGATGVTLAPLASLSVHIVSPTTSATCGVVHNSASATSGNDGSPSVGPVDITVQCPLLAIAKTADADSVSAGDQIGYTITVSNSDAAGTGTATGVKLSDTLPSNAGLSWTIDTTTNPPSAGWGGTCGIDAGVLTCGGTNGVSLAPGASLSVHIVSPTTSATCGVVPNSASVSGTNNVGSPSVGPVDITVLCPAIHITKTADADLVEAGDPIGFTVTVTNTGEGNATGVTLTDALPGGKAATPVHWVIDGSKGDPSAFAITGADGSQQLTLAGQPISLASGASLTVHITAATSGTTKNNCATYNNTAGVTTTNDGHDSASASTKVICPAISIVKTANPTSGQPGDPVTYTYKVTNTGDTTLYNVIVTDDKLGAINADHPIVSLAPGQVVILTKKTTLPKTAGLLTNVGTVTGHDVLGKTVSAHDNATVTVVLPVILVKTGTNTKAAGLVGFLFIAIGVFMTTRKERGRVRPAFAASSGVVSRAVMLAAHRRSWRVRRRRGPPTRARDRMRGSQGPPMRDGP